MDHHFAVIACRFLIKRSNYILYQRKLENVRRYDQAVPAGIRQDHCVGIAQIVFSLHLVEVDLFGLQRRCIGRGVHQGKHLNLTVRFISQVIQLLNNDRHRLQIFGFA